MAVSELLIANLLDGQTIALAGGVRPAVVAGLSRLGARLVTLAPDEPDAQAWAAARAPIDALVYDAAPSFSGGGVAELRAAVDGGWDAIHAAATAAFIPGGRGAAIVLLAPPGTAGPHATAVRAALENTARTLSIEWARFGITTTAIAPGPGTPDEGVATLVAFLVSTAGRYFSGCRFDLGTI